MLLKNGVLFKKINFFVCYARFAIFNRNLLRKRNREFKKKKQAQQLKTIAKKEN